jgi:hypothetical protein
MGSKSRILRTPEGQKRGHTVLLVIGAILLCIQLYFFLRKPFANEHARRLVRVWLTVFVVFSL